MLLSSEQSNKNGNKVSNNTYYPTMLFYKGEHFLHSDTKIGEKKTFNRSEKNPIGSGIVNSAGKHRETIQRAQDLQGNL